MNTFYSNRSVSLAAVWIVVVLATAGFFFASPVQSQQNQVEPGTIISAQNLDQLYDKKFEGHTIGSMLTEVQERLIRKRNLKIPLYHSQDYRYDTAVYNVTEKYSDQVEFHPEDNSVRGWVAGIPFPDVSEDDPNAAWMVRWNNYYAAPDHNIQNYKYGIVQIGGNSGVERTETWTWQKYRLLGWPVGPKANYGDGSIYFKLLNFAFYPQDIRGVGTFAIRYNNGQLDDRWAYLRAIQRTRRLTGGEWMEPLGGSDLLYTDAVGNLPYPKWYKDFELVDVRTILAPTMEATKRPWNPDASSPQEKFRDLNQQEEPYWWPNTEVSRWEPFEVYVIKGTPPDEHRYGYTLSYISTDVYSRRYREDFDKNGNYWHGCYYPLRSKKGVRHGLRAWYVIGQTCWDVKLNHGTKIMVNYKDAKFNQPQVGPDDFSLEALRSGNPPRPPGK